MAGGTQYIDVLTNVAGQPLAVVGPTALTLDTAGALQLNSSAGAIQIGNDAVAQNINIGEAGARTIAVGSAAATAVTVDAIALSLDASTDSNLSITANGMPNATLTLAVANAGAGEARVAISATDQADFGDGTGSLQFNGGVTTLTDGTATYTSTAGALTSAGITTYDIQASGAVTIDSTAGAISIGADADAGDILIGTAGARIIGIGHATATAVTIDAGLFSIDGHADTCNITSTTTLDAQDFTVSLAGATNSSLILSSTGTGSDAVQMTATVGGIDITSAAQLDLVSANEACGWTHTANGDGDDLTIGVLGATDSSLALASFGTGADAVQLIAASGGMVLSSTAQVSSWSHTATGPGQDLTIAVIGAVDASLVLTSAGTAADALQVTASNGGVAISASLAAANALTINSTAGGLTLDAASGLEINCSAGPINVGNDAAGQPINIGTGGARVIIVGNAGATSLTLEAGAGGLIANADTTVTVTGGSLVTIAAPNGTAPAFQVTDGTTAILSIDTTAETLTLGNATDNTAIQLAGTGNVLFQATKIFLNAAAEVALWHDDVLNIADPADTTKRMRIDAGAVTAGQTRVLSMTDFDLDLANLVMVAAADPGTGNPIPVTTSGSYNISTGAGAETNTLAIPGWPGQLMSLVMDVHGGGDRVVTVASGIDAGGNTTITMGNVGDYIIMMGTRVAAAGTLAWRVLVNDGCLLA